MITFLHLTRFSFSTRLIFHATLILAHSNMDMDKVIRRIVEKSQDPTLVKKRHQIDLYQKVEQELKLELANSNETINSLKGDETSLDHIVQQTSEMDMDKFTEDMTAAAKDALATIDAKLAILKKVANHVNTIYQESYDKLVELAALQEEIAAFFDLKVNVQYKLRHCYDSLARKADFFTMTYEQNNDAMAKFLH